MNSQQSKQMGTTQLNNTYTLKNNAKSINKNKDDDDNEQDYEEE